MRYIVSTLFLAGLMVTAQADDLKKNLESMNKKVCSALLHKDVAKFEKIVGAMVTPDFKYIESGQTMGFDKMVAGMRMGLSGMEKITKAEAKTVKLVIKGNTATATTAHTMSGIMLGPDKKKHVMTFSGMSTDVLKKVGGVWKLASMTWGKQSMKQDGK